jgi:hypothetical protein
MNMQVTLYSDLLRMFLVQSAAKVLEKAAKPLRQALIGTHRQLQIRRYRAPYDYNKQCVINQGDIFNSAHTLRL